MEISTRSQIPGTVVEVHQGEVMLTVKMDIGNGVMVTRSRSAMPSSRSSRRPKR